MTTPSSKQYSVVTGANGFIGRHLCSILRERGDVVSKWDLPDVDLTASGNIEELIARDQPQTIYHLAAAGVESDRAHDSSIIGTNVKMLENLLSHAQKGTVLVLAGSMSEYGIAGRLKETMMCAPTTAYGVGKLAATTYAMAYGPQRGIKICVARLFGVYGPGENARRLFPMLVQGLNSREVVPLSDGEQRRDFIHVLDVCEALFRLARCSGADPLLVNVGTGIAVPVREVACRIADDLGKPRSLLGFGQRPRSPGDADILEADVERLSALLGWCPPQRFREDESILGLLGRHSG
jgi:UDP-glucose 4-epimerase